VVLFLAEHPGSYKGEIQTALGLPVSSLGRLLSALEETGAIFGDVSTASNDRRGYAVRYTADIALIRSAIDQPPGLLLGSSAH